MLTDQNACISAVSERILMPFELTRSGIKALPAITIVTSLHARSAEIRASQARPSTCNIFVLPCSRDVIPRGKPLPPIKFIFFISPASGQLRQKLTQPFFNLPSHTNSYGFNSCQKSTRAWIIKGRFWNHVNWSRPHFGDLYQPHFHRFFD